MNRDFKGVWIPKHIWLNEELTMLDKVLLVEIDSLDQSERGCFASNKYLAEFCQCSESAVSKSISKLTKMGLLTCINFDGRQRELKSNMTSIVKSNKDSSKIYSADEQNLLHNNIVNNTDNNINNISPNGQTSKNTNGKLFSTDTEIKKPKQNGYIEIIQDLAQHPQIRDALLEYCNFRRGRGLTHQQWRLMVEEFKNQCGGKSVDEIVNCIKQCVMNGRNTLYFADYTKSGNNYNDYSKIQHSNTPQTLYTKTDQF